MMLNYLGKYVVKRADAVRAVSRKISRDVQALSVPSERILYIPSVAVDVEFFKSPAETRDPVVLCVARLVKQKALHLALHAFALLKKAEPHAILKIAGRGPEETSLKSLVSSLGLSDSVEFIREYLPSAELAKLYSSSWVYLNTSYYEGGPRAVFEAMACGTPAVSTPVGLAGELIRHGVNGYISSWDPQQIASTLARAFKADARRATLEENARATVVNHCRWAEIFQRYAESVREFVESYRRPL